MEFNGKYVLVMGAKRSGLAAAELLRAQGATVRVMDAGALTDEEQARFAAMAVPVVGQEAENIEHQGRLPNVVVLSPGVPYDLELVEATRGRGVPVIGEVELASYFLQGPVIGITGSNGKTTTTALTGHLLRESGVACQVGGNIGTAVTGLIASSKPDQWNVLELSSFQLETIRHFRARIGACLNVTPDHLDRHHTFENYAAAKRRLFETQTADDVAVLNFDDPLCREFAKAERGEIYWFSSREAVPRGVFLSGREIVWGGEPLLDRETIPLRGLHNVENVMAACLLAHLAGAPLQQAAAAVASFPGVEHRIEFVRQVNGVSYYNDSKATNVDATLKAIDAFPSGLWIILGGKDKSSEYRPLREPLASRAKGALLIGAPPPYPHAAAPLIRRALEGALPVTDCATLAEAVDYARAHAQPGDTVLLAPACASFDQFQNYEERGRAFKHLVGELF